MRSLRTLTFLVVAGALVAPAIAASAQDDEGGLGIRLAEAPTSAQDDPRAQVYVVDHVEQGTTITRRIEVRNGSQGPMRPELYVAGAEIADGAFQVGGRDAGELTEWGSIEPGSIELAPGEIAAATLTIAVPDTAEDGEYYGGAVAAATSDTGGPVDVQGRVAVRIYLSVGEGAPPEADFEVSTLEASRRSDGTPVVSASVTNTGGRALDMAGDLHLDHGPGGIAAGPFPATLGTTLGIGDTEPVIVLLDPELPNGPWDATLTLRSGKLEKTVTATIEFPEPGEEPRTFDAEEQRHKSWWALLALLLLLLALGLLLWFLWRRRKKRKEDEDAGTTVGTA